MEFSQVGNTMDQSSEKRSNAGLGSMQTIAVVTPESTTENTFILDPSKGPRYTNYNLQGFFIPSGVRYISVACQCTWKDSVSTTSLPIIIPTIKWVVRASPAVPTSITSVVPFTNPITTGVVIAGNLIFTMPAPVIESGEIFVSLYTSQKTATTGTRATSVTIQGFYISFYY